jgi:hypothetical protein
LQQGHTIDITIAHEGGPAMLNTGNNVLFFEKFVLSFLNMPMHVGVVHGISTP